MKWVLFDGFRVSIWGNIKILLVVTVIQRFNQSSEQGHRKCALYDMEQRKTTVALLIGAMQMSEKRKCQRNKGHFNMARFPMQHDNLIMHEPSDRHRYIKQSLNE